MVPGWKRSAPHPRRYGHTPLLQTSASSPDAADDGDEYLVGEPKAGRRAENRSVLINSSWTGRCPRESRIVVVRTPPPSICLLGASPRAALEPHGGVRRRSSASAWPWGTPPGFRTRPSPYRF